MDTLLAMDIWAALGKFFGTFQPKDWVTFGAAVLALVLTLISNRQTRWYFPRPYFRSYVRLYGLDGRTDGPAPGEDDPPAVPVAKKTEEPEPEKPKWIRPYLRFIFVNYGAEAAGVRYWLFSPAGRWQGAAKEKTDSAWFRYQDATITPKGASVYAEVSLITGSPDKSSGGYWPAAGKVRKGFYGVVLHWHQPPDRLRRYRLRLRLVLRQPRPESSDE